MESRVKKSSRNVFTGVLSKLLTFVFAFTTRTVFIRLLGAEYTGVNGLYTNILQVLSLADLGIHTVLTYSLYQAIKDNDIGLVASLTAYYKKIYFTIGTAVVCIGLCIVPFLKYIIKDIDIPLSRLIIYYILFLANSAASYYFVHLTTIIEADQKQYIANITGAVSTLLMYIVQICYLIIIKSYIGYLLIQIMFTVLRNIVLSLYSLKKYPFLKDKKKINLNLISKDSIYKNIKATFIYKICKVMIDNTDNILISIIVGTVAVGYYSNYYLIIQYVSAYVYALSTGLLASIGNYSANNTSENTYSLYNSIFLLYSLVSCVCTSIFITCIQGFIPIWIGKEYLLGWDSVIAISICFGLNIMNAQNWMFREAMGVFTEVQNILIPTLVINIILSIVGGNLFGIAGVVVATAISKLLTNYWYEPMILYKKFNISIKKFYIKQIRSIFTVVLSSVICVVVCSYLKNSILFIVSKGFISLLISLSIWYFINRKSEGIDRLVQILKRTIGRLIPKINK